MSPVNPGESSAIWNGVRPIGRVFTSSTVMFWLTSVEASGVGTTALPRGTLTVSAIAPTGIETLVTTALPRGTLTVLSTVVNP